jgi:hypothetical protein
MGLRFALVELLKGLGVLAATLLVLFLGLLLVAGISDFCHYVSTGHYRGWDEGYVDGQKAALQGHWIVEKQHKDYDVIVTTQPVK